MGEDELGVLEALAARGAFGRGGRGYKSLGVVHNCYPFGDPPTLFGSVGFCVVCVCRF